MRARYRWLLPHMKRRTRYAQRFARAAKSDLSVSAVGAALPGAKHTMVRHRNSTSTLDEDHTFHVSRKTFPYI